MPPTAPQSDPPRSTPAQTASRPAYRCRRAIALFAIVFVVLLATDLGFKVWSFEKVPHDNTGWTLIPNTLALRLTVNHGAVFGMMQGQKFFFIAASLVALGMIGYFFSQTGAHERATHFALAAILAGAMGNLYDRIAHGGVRDMLLLLPDVKLPWGLRWPGGLDEVYPWIFNLADVFLLVGIALIVIRSFLPSHHPQDPEPQPKKQP